MQVAMTDLTKMYFWEFSMCASGFMSLLSDDAATEEAEEHEVLLFENHFNMLFLHSNKCLF